MKEQDLDLLIVRTAFLMDMAISMAAFKKICPEYVDTPENAEAISGFFPEQMARAPTVLEVHKAYEMALKAGKIKYGRPN